MEKYYLGIDMGGTTINIGLVSSNGDILEERILNTLSEKGPNHAFEKISGSVKAIRKSLDNDKTIVAAGVGIPGIYDKQEDKIQQASNLPGWENICLAEILRVYVNTDVFIENDANMAALGEDWRGAGKDMPFSFMITLGTGVGGAIVSNNKIFSFNDTSGEFGHMIIQADGPLCPCGRRGCIETFIGTQGMKLFALELLRTGRMSKLRNMGSDALTPYVIAHAADEGDEVALKVYERGAFGLATGIANIANVLGIDVFILGGGITNAFHLIEDTLEQNLRQLIFDYESRKIKIKRAELGEKAGLIGAARFAMVNSDK